MISASSNDNPFLQHQDTRSLSLTFGTIQQDRTLSSTCVGELIKIVSRIQYQVGDEPDIAPLIWSIEASDALPVLHLMSRFHPESIGVRNAVEHVQRQLVKAGWDREFRITGKRWGDASSLSFFDQIQLLKDKLKVDEAHRRDPFARAMEGAYHGLKLAILGNGDANWERDYRYARFLMASAKLFTDPDSYDLVTLMGEPLELTDQDHQLQAPLTEEVRNAETFAEFDARAKERKTNPHLLFEINLGKNSQADQDRRHARLGLLLTDLRRESKAPMDDQGVLNRLVPYHDCKKASGRRVRLASILQAKILAPARTLIGR